MNSQIKSVVYVISALLLLAGAILQFVKIVYAPYLFAVGAAGVTVCYLTERDSDTNFRVRRLLWYNIIAGVLMIIASALMFNDNKEWVLFLTVAAIMQLYSAFMIPKIIKDEEKKHKKTD